MSRCRFFNPACPASALLLPAGPSGTQLPLRPRGHPTAGDHTPIRAFNFHRIPVSRPYPGPWAVMNKVCRRTRHSAQMARGYNMHPQQNNFIIMAFSWQAGGALPPTLNKIGKNRMSLKANDYRRLSPPPVGKHTKTQPSADEGPAGIYVPGWLPGLLLAPPPPTAPAVSIPRPAPSAISCLVADEPRRAAIRPDFQVSPLPPSDNGGKLTLPPVPKRTSSMPSARRRRGRHRPEATLTHSRHHRASRARTRSRFARPFFAQRQRTSAWWRRSFYSPKSGPSHPPPKPKRKARGSEGPRSCGR